jgi:ABC-type uncharacterized transport system permease subunit
MLMNNVPVTIAAALGGLLSTGVALVAIIVPGLTQEAQLAIIAFGNAVIGTVVLIVQLLNSTSNTAPVVVPGTDVTVKTAEGIPNRIITLTGASGVPVLPGS